ncbi:MAG: nucleotidyltransferase [Bacilli bacterium]|nr:nucleotidyltransferase [Bacilli bacterium]MDD4718475.1 nucleotidyltransferase [Bacilli bacterium]
MKSVGIICEYNPFHNGHLYHLNRVKELYPNYTIILIMSGNFLQRGESSIIDKWTKTKIALEYGIDLVVELPYVFSSQNADLFARGSIELLNHLNVEAVIFGSESNDIDLLDKIADLSSSDKYNKLIKIYLDEGLSYPKASSDALTKLTGEAIDTPNDILGISYIKEIKKLKSNIKPISIKRTNNYHSKKLDNNITSASSIRLALKNNLDIENYVPNITYNYLNNKLHFIDDYFPFLKYKILSEINNLHIYQTIDEGIENRIKKYIVKSNSLEELIDYIKTKRYTHNKIMRMLTHILCSFTKVEANSFKHIEYIRVLGFSENGRKYLNNIKKELTVPLVTNYSKLDNKMLELEFRVTCVYASILNEVDKTIMIENEYKNNPMI